MTKDRVEQIDVDEISHSEDSQDNTSNDFNISLLVPENIEIRMVDANQLGQYEIWFSGATVILSVAVSFITAWFLDTNLDTKPILGGVSLIFLAIFIFFLVMMLVTRHALKKKERSSSYTHPELWNPQNDFTGAWPTGVSFHSTEDDLRIAGLAGQMQSSMMVNRLSSHFRALEPIDAGCKKN